MSKTKIEITGEIEFTYDENSMEFKEALEGYRDCMDKGASKIDMLKHCAFYITKFGIYSMVEGVGYVGYCTRIPTKEPYSGIMVSGGYDDFLFD